MSNNDNNKERHTARQEILGLLVNGIVERATEKAQKPLRQLQENLPSDAASVRNLAFYDSTVRAIQWQRDNYLVGTDYAEQRTREREYDVAPPIINEMPFDATALGSMQIIRLGSWFIPSPTVKNALMPIVLPLPTGALYQPALNAAAHALPLAQDDLNRVVKNSMMQFISNPHWREVIKNGTNRYMGSRESNNAGDNKETNPSASS
jgi:hypothetical protein